MNNQVLKAFRKMTDEQLVEICFEMATRAPSMFLSALEEIHPEPKIKKVKVDDLLIYPLKFIPSNGDMGPDGIKDVCAVTVDGDTHFIPFESYDKVVNLLRESRHNEAIKYLRTTFRRNFPTRTVERIVSSIHFHLNVPEFHMKKVATPLEFINERIGGGMVKYNFIDGSTFHSSTSTFKKLAAFFDKEGSRWTKSKARENATVFCLSTLLLSPKMSKDVVDIVASWHAGNGAI